MKSSKQTAKACASPLQQTTQPEGALNLLNRWAKLRDEYVVHAETPADELSDVAIQGLNGYFRTHPLPSERLAQAQRVIAEDHLPVDRPLKPFRIEYEITSGDR